MADHRHKRDTHARRTPRAAFIAGPIAVLATASAVTIGVVADHPSSGDLLASPDTSAAVSGAAGRRDEPVSRSSSRLDRVPKLDPAAARMLQRAYELTMSRAATRRAVARADERKWTTTLLNLWTGPGEGATRVGVLDSGKHVLVTGRHTAERVELVIDGESRWVTAGYLSDEKPTPEEAPAATSATTPATGSSAGVTMAPCPDSSVEDGLTSEAVRVYRTVCHAFPQITTYLGWDAHGEHSSGQAIDIMTSDKALGDQIAAFLQSHASELDLYDIIWYDRIWTPERASEGWRDYGDHGSATANHMDHVHVSTNG